MTVFNKTLPAALVAAMLAGGLALPAAAQMDQGGKGKMEMPMGSDVEVTLGDLTLTGSFAFATLPNSPVAGGFLTITNAGDTDDRLLSAASNVSDRTEVHEMKMDGDVMRMRELADGLPIPAGETVTLEPGGYHVMFMKLEEPLVAGDVVSVTLTFESAGEVTLDFPVVDRPGRRGGMTHG